MDAKAKSGIIFEHFGRNTDRQNQSRPRSGADPVLSGSTGPPPVKVLPERLASRVYREVAEIETLFLSKANHIMKKSQAPTKVQSVSIERVKQFSSAFGHKAPEYLVSGLTFDQARYQFALFQLAEAQEQCARMEKAIEAKNVQAMALSLLLKQLQSFN